MSRNMIFPHFRHIEIGAQPVPYILLEDSKKIFPNCPHRQYLRYYRRRRRWNLTNCYDEDIMRKPGSIGKATAFMEAKIVDSEGKKLPRGTGGRTRR